MCRLKLSRLFCLLCVLSVFLGSFGLDVSAASDNLVSDDLRYWQNYDPEYSFVNVLGNFPDINYITIKPQTDSDGINTKVSYFYELPKLVSGNSYTFNFNLLDLAQCQELGLAWTSTHLYYGFLNNNAFLLVGLASYVQGENRFELVEGSSIVIDKTNYLNYYGGSNSISFELPNIVNPCIVISYTEINSSPYNTYIVLKDISLVDNSQAEQDSFFAKLFEGIKSLFVPDEEFIKEWKSELEFLLQERLGIIWDAGDFFISLIQTIGDLLTTTADDIHYELPEMVIELNGQTYTLWQAQQVDFSFLEKNAFFAMLYNLYKAVLNVFLGIPLLNYAKKEMDVTLHN